MTKQVRGLEAASRLVAAAATHALSRRGAPILVAVDGASGAGKSSLAAAVAALVEAVVVGSDDFFAASITNAEWEGRSPEERAREAIDWRRMRRDALEPLLAGRAARWRPFDFGAGPRADGTYALSNQVEERKPAPVIILEGAYSSRPELADLIAISVLVEAPADVREARLRARENPQFLLAWHGRWDEAEAHYFRIVRPRARFDLVVAIDKTRAKL